MKLFHLFVPCIVLANIPAAHALEPLTIEVPNYDRPFQFSVLRGATTPVILPERITELNSWSSEGIEIKWFKNHDPHDGADSGHARTIVLVDADKNAAFASFTITVGRMRIHLLVHGVDDPARASSPVVFVPRDADEQFNARVERAVAKRVGPIEAAAKESAARQEAIIAERARLTMADAVRTEVLRYGNPRQRIAKRSTRGELVVVHEVRWLADYAFLVFSYRNRRDQDFEVASVTLKGPSVLAKAPNWPTGAGRIVPKGDGFDLGVLALPDATAHIGESLVLQITGRSNGGPTRVIAVALELPRR